MVFYSTMKIKTSMFILSITPSSSSTALFIPRVSFPLRHSSTALRSSTVSTSAVSLRPCFGFSWKLKASAEVIQANRESTGYVSAAYSPSTSLGDTTIDAHRPMTFLNARNEQELLSGIREELKTGRLPPNVAAGMEELLHNYKQAVFHSRDPRPEETVLSNMTVALDRMFLDVVDPFVFPPIHKAVRKPFDYYMFGQTYVRPLIDFRNSYVGNISIFNDIEEKLKQGHNIIFMSNHQTEADPAVIALLLEKTSCCIAENMTYVAGDRVVTDPLCKPFSMGRNLICVYSKKHMFDVPALVEMKRKANTRSLKEMALLLRGGSQIVWIAPSGGRDRADPASGEWHPATFDGSSVDNMRRLAEHSGPPGHIYPLAILCHDIMPPPSQVETEIGEKRLISFHGVGLSVAPEANFTEVTACCETPEQARNAYTQALYDSVTEQYNVLKSAIHGLQGFEVSAPSVSLSQPWY